MSSFCRSRDAGTKLAHRAKDPAAATTAAPTTAAPASVYCESSDGARGGDQECIDRMYAVDATQNICGPCGCSGCPLKVD